MTAIQGECRLSKGFSPWEKLWAQLSFNAMVFSGICRNRVLGMALACAISRFHRVRHTRHRHASPSLRQVSHLHVDNDCLQFPPEWTKWLVKERKTAPFSAAERWSSYLIFLLIPLYPLYWLRQQPVLLAVFVASGTMWYLGQWFYFCKRCGPGSVRSTGFRQAPLSVRNDFDGQPCERTPRCLRRAGYGAMTAL